MTYLPAYDHDNGWEPYPGAGGAEPGVVPKTLYYITDIFGSNLGLMEPDGRMSARYHYDEFGMVLDTKKFDVNWPGPDNLIGYTGLEYDYYTDLNYARARYYKPEIGRFISEDTYKGVLGNPQSQNLYTYVENNPINYVDPSGYIPQTPLNSGKYWTTDQRMRFTQEFFKEFSGLSWYEWFDRWLSNGFGYGRAIIDFMDWEIESSRLDESQWWRNVNGQMIDDIKAAWEIWETNKKKDRKSDNPTVQAWLEYMSNPNQEHLWNAHNSSIIKGFGDNVEVLKKEPREEQVFAIYVTYRVVVIAPQIPFMRSMDPFLDWIVQGEYFNELNYPKHYPATFDDGLSVTDLLWGLDDLFKIIGIGD